MSVTEALQAYAARIRELRRANPEVSEPALAPAFQQLLQSLLPLLPTAPHLTIVPEYRNPGVGRPDIAMMREGKPARAFVELKAPSKPADPTRWRDHDRRQFERFKELNYWATCNFVEFRLFQRDGELGSAMVVPERSLRPDQDDRRADRAIVQHDPAAFLRLVETLCVTAGQEPAARDAEHLATLMAHSARLVRGIVRDRLAELHLAGSMNHPLQQVRQDFRDVLYAHPEAGGYSASDFDALFSAAFAQTLAFGLLLVREGTGQPVGVDAWQHMPEEHPLMRTALRVLTLEEVEQDVGIGFDVMRDTVNSFAPEILAVQRDGRDPILFFYEDFLSTFDPEARERYGVYYTPLPVVLYMVGALDRALRTNLATQGLRDPLVTILDPATGTGTFLLGIAERVRSQIEAEAGEGMAALALQNLARRMFGFELLVGPYAVAHYRLHHALRRSARAPQPEPVELPRLGIYLADTLAEPGAAAPAGPLGFVAAGIADERREANRIKAEQPILAIIGNPPYRRLEEGEAAEVFYNDTWSEGIFARQAKFDWLLAGASEGTRPDAVPVRRKFLDDMRPEPFQNGEWITLTACFEFRRSGVQTKRDDFVYSPSRQALIARLTEFRELADEVARDTFASTAARPWNIARAQPIAENRIQLVAYRPLDRRWLYNEDNFIDRPRPELQGVWGNSNVCLYALPSGTGEGPAGWCHGLVPDYHAFRGSYGGYAFPLWDRRPNFNRTNISASLIENLSAAYGEPITPEDIFDAILCLLSAASYSLRFAEDLEDVFPHVPFPTRREVFSSAAALGREIRAVETFARAPREEFLRPSLARVASAPHGAVGKVTYQDSSITLCEDGSGRITGLPQFVWDFAVSGYRVLPRWLEAREGLPADFDFVSELRDICGRITELIDLYGQADRLLEATLHDTLTREALGLDALIPEQNDERE